MRAFAAAICYDQLVYCEPLRPRNLHQDAITITICNRGKDRVGKQIVEVAKRSGVHTKCWQRSKVLRRRLVACLLPAPDLARVQRGDWFEREIPQDIFKRLGDRIAQRDGETFKARNVDVTCLGGLVEGEADAEFVLVESECMRAHDCSAETKDTRRSQRVQQATSRGVDAEETLRAGLLGLNDELTGRREPDEPCPITPLAVASLSSPI